MDRQNHLSFICLSPVPAQGLTLSRPLIGVELEWFQPDNRKIKRRLDMESEDSFWVSCFLLIGMIQVICFTWSLTCPADTVVSVCVWKSCHFSRVRLCATPQTAARQAPPSLGFSRQEHWSGLPFPSPMNESEEWKWSRSVMSDS